MYVYKLSTSFELSSATYVVNMKYKVMEIMFQRMVGLSEIMV